MKNLRSHSRQWAFVVALLWMAGQLTAGLHFFVVRHEICQQHGELVHADHENSGLSRLHGSQAPNHHALTTEVPETELEHGDHDHCVVSLCDERRAIFMRVASNIAARPPPYLFEPKYEHRIIRISSTLVFFVAPKNSPPV